MIALTVRQPWAWAILHAGKDVENRSWWWPRKHELPCTILIHSSAKLLDEEYAEAEGTFLDAGVKMPPLGELVTGAILGSVTVYDCVSVGSVRSNPWARGPFCWILREPVAFARPVQCKGRLGLWEPPADVFEQIENEVKP